VRIRAIVPILLLAVSATAAERGLEVGLEITPRQVLPGIPAVVALEIRNTTDYAQDLPQMVSLLARPSGSANQSRLRGELGRTVVSIPDAPSEIAPGAVFRAEFEFDHILVGVPWFFDPLLSQPGRYELVAQLEAADGDPRPPRATLLSNSVTFEVLQPHGENAAVWHYLSGLSEEGAITSDVWITSILKVATFVVEQHPTSEYHQYVAALYPAKSLDQRIDRMIEGLRHVTDPRAEISLKKQLSIVGRRRLAEMTRAREHERAEALVARLVKELSREIVNDAEARRVSAELRAGLIAGAKRSAL
jgi:hypothetical protein